VAGGYLKPNFHQFYWTSLKRISNVWQWSDYMFRGPFGSKAYQNWGTYKPGGFMEPYSGTGQTEDCGGSNFTQTVNQAWGWANAPCGSSYVSVCRMQREWQDAGGCRHMRLASTCLISHLRCTEVCLA
jgi:hypothetical protein